MSYGYINADSHTTSAGFTGDLQVCALVTHAQTHLSIIRKLYGVSIPVVYSNVNHMTHILGGYRDADVGLEESAF